MTRSRTLLDGLPAALRAPVAGALALGVLGGAVGLVVGLLSYPPTAWFAALEVGVPAAWVGLLGGLVVAAATHLRGRLRRDSGRRPSGGST